jgi:hypothetical protein
MSASGSEPTRIVVIPPSDLVEVTDLCVTLGRLRTRATCRHWLTGSCREEILPNQEYLQKVCRISDSEFSR